MALAVDPFLTSYDPSDLPGGSIDPLGFDRAYNHLANCFLPGLTNVASVPRYFSVLCTGILLANVSAAATPREKLQIRLESVQRLERFWGVANVLASVDDSDMALGGLRGVRYARGRVQETSARGKTTCDFRMLLQQQRYGVIGIYGLVADNLRLIHRSTMDLTPDRGRRLAEAFRDGTLLPGEVARAIADSKVTVAFDKLRGWGKRARIDVRLPEGEGRWVREALMEDGIRVATAALLHQCPRKDDQSELVRLSLMRDRATNELRELLVLIVAFEEFFLSALLAFQRLLFLAEQSENGSFGVEDARTDEVVSAVRLRIAKRADALKRAVEALQAARLLAGRGVVGDVVEFGTQLVAARDEWSFVERLVGRHHDVQRGKVDRGRPKMPWLERSGDRWQLTLADMSDLRAPPKREDDLAAHPYRTLAADSFGASHG